MLPKLLTPGEDMRETIINSHTSEVIRYMLTKIHTPTPPPISCKGMSSKFCNPDLLRFSLHQFEVLEETKVQM
jgi:hypothetical protein